MESEMIYTASCVGGAKLFFPSLEAARVRGQKDIGKCGDE